MAPTLLSSPLTGDGLSVSTLVRIDRLEKDGELTRYQLQYEDGTIYEIDQYTAEWLDSMTRSLLKIRM